MSQDSEQPELRAVDRRYRPYDGQRFENLLQASVGSASLGKVYVDCKFLFKKSKWGTLDNRKAGIIYLDLTFSQPGDYCLRSATIQVTLDDEDKHLVREPSDKSRPSPLQIRKCGPREIRGDPRSETVLTRNKVIPEIEVGSVAGVGGVGHESMKMTVRECWWRFESHIQPSKKAKAGVRTYKVLQWNITESELQVQPSHSNTFHTAFSFDHGGQPFFMDVEVRGKLRSKTLNLGHKLGRIARFPSSSQSHRSTTTLIHFTKLDKFTTPLDDLEKRLHEDLQRDNMSYPVVAPDTKERIIPESLLPSPSQQPHTIPPTEGHLKLEGKGNEGPTIDECVARASKLLRQPMAPQRQKSIWTVHLNDTVIRPVTIWIIWVMQIVATCLGYGGQ